MPAEILAAWEEHDLDAVAAWLLTIPEVERWGRFAREKAAVLAKVFLSIDPALSLQLADRLLSEGDADLHLLQLTVDAAARSGNRAGIGRRVELVRDALRDVDPDVRSSVLSNVGTFLKAARLFDLAESILNEALQEDTASPTTRVTVMVNLATVIADRAQSHGTESMRGNAAALEMLDAAEGLATRLVDPRMLGNIWFNRGHILATGGSSAQAAHAYTMAEQCFTRAGGDSVDLAYVYRARAADAGRNGRLDDALADYLRARDLFADAGMLDESATAAVGLVMSMQLSGSPPTPGQLEGVLDALRRSRPDRVPELLINLGNIAAEQDLGRAARYFADAEAAFRAQERPLDVQRARHARAVIRRRAGDPVRAVTELHAVHAKYAQWGLAVKAAEAEFNIAVALRDLNDPLSTTHALHAFEILDRHRHELGTASDRSGVARVTYRHLLDLALHAVTATEDYDTVAALAERARTQTAAGAERVPGSDQLAAPSPVRARPGARVIDGEGDVRTLSTLAADLAGQEAVWLTWVRHGGTLLRVLVSPQHTNVTAIPYPSELLTGLESAVSAASADPHAGPVVAALNDRAALYRIATGPLLADPVLAERLRQSMPPSAAVPWGSAHDTGAGTEILRQLADALLPDEAWTAPAVVVGPPSFLGSVPWASLQRAGTHWIEQTRIVLSPPVSTIRHAPATGPGSGRAWIANATGGLHFCSRTLPGWHVLAEADATTAGTMKLLQQRGRVVVRTHVRPGSAAHPRQAALRLADGPLTANTLYEASGDVPPEWIILGCDAAGAGVGDEWAGLPIGLGAVGAERLIVTLWPIVDALEQEELDLKLIAAIEEHGIRDGIHTWQRDCAQRWRQTGDRSVSPHRWAGHCLVVTVTGSDQHAPTE